jgi:hypothetical protein
LQKLFATSICLATRSTADTFPDLNRVAANPSDASARIGRPGASSSHTEDADRQPSCQRRSLRDTLRHHMRKAWRHSSITQTWTHRICTLNTMSREAKMITVLCASEIHHHKKIHQRLNSATIRSIAYTRWFGGLSRWVYASVHT